MKLYKIKTLGSEFLFAVDAVGAFTGAPKEAVRLSFSDTSDFELDYELTASIFLPDLQRAAAVYIDRVLGYPASEYEVKTPLGKRNVCVRADGILKTEIISASDIGEPYSLDGKEIYRTDVCKSAHAVILAEDERGVDLEYILRYLRLSDMKTPRYAIALAEGSDNEYRICARGARDGAYTPDSRAYAAAAAFILSRGTRRSGRVQMQSSLGRVSVEYDPPHFLILSSDAEAQRIY